MDDTEMKRHSTFEKTMREDVAFIFPVNEV